MRCFYFGTGRKRGTGRSAMTGPSKSFRHTPTESESRSYDVPVVGSGHFSPSSSAPVFSQKHENLRVFRHSELKEATRNFSRSLVVGEGGFGCVYRGTIKSTKDPRKKVVVAVKQLNRRGMQGHQQWLTEVNVLGKVEHQNLVKLIGFCAEDDERGMQRLLVYEFMSNQSVLDHLSPQSAAPFPWQMRVRVALDAARGLTYLHEEMTFQIIFRDFKTSNILLDEQWNAKLSDFGLAREGPEEGRSHVSTAAVGTLGYAAPDYMQTGHLTEKSDIWSYGVVLYELITGRHPIDHNRPKGEQKLLDWVRPFISNYHKFPSIIDPRLANNYDLRSVCQLAAVANRCLIRKPKSRPKMSQVLAQVAEIFSTTATGSPLQFLPMDEEVLRRRRRDEM